MLEIIMIPLLYAGFFFVPFCFLFGYWLKIKNRKDYTFNIPGFDSIVGKKGEERIKAIESFYHDTAKVESLIINSSLFYRKAYLIWQTEGHPSKRELLTIVLGAFLGGLASSFCSLQFLGEKLVSDNGDTNALPMCLFLFWVSTIFCLLLNAFLGKPRDKENFIYEYELSYIEKALEKRISKDNMNTPSESSEIRLKVNGEISVLTQKE